MPEAIAYWRIVVESRGSVTRIHIPPVRRWRDLPRSYWWILLPLFFATFASIDALVARYHKNMQEFYGVMPTAAMYSIITGLIALLAAYRLQRYIILEINPTQFRVLHAHHDRAAPRITLQRSEIGQIRVSRSDGKLYVPVTQGDSFEIFLTSSSEVNQWIGEAVAKALQGNLMESTSTSQGIDYASPYTSEETPVQPTRSRRFLIGTSFVLIGVAIVLFCTPIAPAGFILLIAAAVPAGLGLGSQKKDYYFF